jgi:hypothetical protein
MSTTPTSATAVEPLPAALVYRIPAEADGEIHVLEPGGADRRVLTLPSHAGHREVVGCYLAYTLNDAIYLADLIATYATGTAWPSVKTQGERRR